MTAMRLGADQEDALREIVNMAMGRAANMLARLLDRFVRLPVPRLRLVGADEILSGVLEMTGGMPRVTCVRQAFTSSLRGEALVLFEPRGLDDLACLVEPGLALMDDANLLELSNLLVGACVGSTAHMLGKPIVLSPPSVLLRDGALAEVLGTAARPWEYALLVEVSFSLEGHRFMSHIFVFFPEESLVEVRHGIDVFLEGVG